ncbi:SusC/RagA family TonB-linked outer membrane protein [Tenacibaculum sediminilitoris]|uniref:SusC/RagA family TonB-linked outer membrane protein n=1 Tax=Tenacibaculum sediminilitoris TaxID=1820334 RepID=UPI0038965995
MRTKFNGILTLFLALIVQISFAQEKTISGTVSDESGPLPGVTILKKGTTQGTETDFDGNYSIQAKTGDILVYSFVGMKTAERTVGASNQISIVLETDNLLEEVVVVGYGTTTKKAYAGTASVVSTENLEAKSFSNVSQALAGEVAGVTVINTSGQPGTVGTVRIRGYGSPLGNRAPLYVIDGIALGSAFNLNSINPSDIKSTTVLKDATATAIYGSRGANGVILITTKSGTSSAESSYIEADVKTGVNFQAIPRYNVMRSPEKYIGLVWEGLYNRGVGSGQADPVAYANGLLLGDNGIGSGYNMWNAATAADLIDPNTRSVREGVNRLYTPERYADEAFGTGIRTEANLRLGGGSEKSKYFFSMGYLDDSGYSINSDYSRITTRLNLTSDIKEWLEVGANIGYAYSESNNNGQTAGSENLFEFADKMAPIYPVFARFPNTGDLIPDPVYGGYQYDYGSPTGATNGFDRTRPNANLLNPIGSAVLDINRAETHALNGNVNTKFKLSDEFSAEVRFGGQYSFERFASAGNHAYGTAAQNGGTLFVRDRIRWSQTFTQLLRYKKSFGDHNFEALLGHELFKFRFESSSQSKQEVIVPGLLNLSNYLQPQTPAGGTQNGSAIESYFGQVNYNYLNKYYLTGSLRTDGSSRFIKEKWGVFGSVGASWVISEEDFMSNSIFSFLKAKVSWGVTGDQDGATTTDAFSVFGSDVAGGKLALFETRPGRDLLTWETSRMLQGGIEASLGNYLDANFDYYRKNTDNLFFDQRVGPSAGFSSIVVNDGEVLNAGLEFDITGHIFNKQDFKLDLSLNGEMLSNEFITLPIDPTTGKEKIIDENSSADGAYAFAPGRSMFDFYMREWAGVDPSDGAPMWYQYYDDKNNNDVLDAGEEDFSTLENGDESSTSSLYEYEKLSSNTNIKRQVTKIFSDATQKYLNKSFIPDLRGSFRLSGKVKSFDFSTQFTYSLGGYAYDAQYAELMSDRFGAAGNNFHRDILNRWQQPGDITDVPALTDNFITNSTSLSSRFITSTDYIALNNARIGYTVPSKFMGDSGIDNINIWMSGDNLYLNSAREGFNPSVRENGSSARRIYAPATTITMGVRVKF